jgi:hypothetical protein
MTRTKKPNRKALRKLVKVVKKIRRVDINKSKYEKAITELLEKKNGMIHHSDLAAYLGIAPSTAIGYMRIYAIRHGIEYYKGWLFKVKESEETAPQTTTA